MTKLQLLDLFSGIGGFSLGLERTGGFDTVAFCEIEDFPRRVLAKHWPKVPCYHDIRELTAARLAADGIAVDAICGGFPCQDISVAGKGAGLAGERSGLWTEYARLIGELRPRVVFVENVAALLSRGMGVVLGDLATLGYNAEWHGIRACRVGLPHNRDRIWIVAYAREERAEGKFTEALSRLSAFQGCENVRRAENFAHRSDLSASGLCRTYNGIPNGMDRVASCGNAVAPEIVELLGRAYLEAMEVQS
jgi:DNA (cytosine-5)-methyltransferase 1